MYKILRSLTVVLILMLFLNMLPDSSGVEYGEPVWTVDQWNDTAPSHIYGKPVISHEEHLIYLTGKSTGDFSSFYSVELNSGSPEVQKMLIQGKGTSSPRVYPESDDDNFIRPIWNERVYFGTDQGVLYRVEGESMELGWSFDLSAILNRDIGIEHTPVIYEYEDHIMLFVATSNSLHALEDPRDASEPRLLWNLSLSPSGTLNQPALFRDPNDMEATMAVTSTGGDIFAIGISGDNKWELHLDDSPSPPVVPLNMKLGETSEQFFYVIGRNTLYRIPITTNTDGGDINQLTIDEEYHLKMPTISYDGKTIWLPTVRETHTKIHYIDVDRLNWDDEYTPIRTEDIDGKITGELLHVERKSLLMAATTSGKLHCLKSEVGFTGELWNIELNGDTNPSSILHISQNFSPGFVDTVIMVIYQGSGGTEGWDMSNLPKSNPFFTDDTDDIISAFCGLCYLALGAVWVIVVIVIAIIFIIRRKKKTPYQGPPYGR